MVRRPTRKDLLDAIKGWRIDKIKEYTIPGTFNEKGIWILLSRRKDC